VKYQITVKIFSVNVDDRYFSFGYEVWLGNKKNKKDTYESDHAWSDDKEGFVRLLKGGGAMKLALEQTFQ